MSLTFNPEKNEISHNGLIRFAVDKLDHNVEAFVWFNGEGIYDMFIRHDDTILVPDHDEIWEFLGSVYIAADPALVLAKRKSEVLAHLYKTVNNVYVDLASNYTEIEKESWKQQEAEARALKAVATPTIDALCAVRGCSRDELADKIIANANAATVAGLNTLAWQQGMEAKIRNMSIEDFSTLWEEIANV